MSEKWKLNEIDSRIASILKESGIHSPAIPVAKIVKNQGLGIMPYDFDDNISGALLVEGDSNATIGFNSSESEVRRRFTIAHELGHYLLHKDSSIYYDRPQILFRDGNSSSGYDKKEREANRFAASLLMPKFMLTKSLEDERFRNPNSTDEKIIKNLSIKYKVSQIAMTYRLANLGHINY